MVEPSQMVVAQPRGDLEVIAPYARQREAEESRAESPDPWVRSDAWVERWITSRRTRSTGDRYREGFASLQRYAEMIGKAPLQMTRRDIEVWKRALEEVGNPAAEHPRRLSPATVARHMATASSFYRYCLDFEESGIVRNPVPGKDGRPEVPKESSQRYLTPAQVHKVTVIADEDGANSAAFIALLLCCLRVSEVANAHVPDISESGGHRVITVVRKGGRVQTVPLPPPAWVRCQRAIGDRTDGPIVSLDGVTPFSRQALTVRVSTLARRAGIQQRVTAHTFRHAAITRALRNHPLHEVQNWAGHSDPKTTERYWREAENHDRSPAYDVLSDFYSEGGK